MHSVAKHTLAADDHPLDIERETLACQHNQENNIAQNNMTMQDVPNPNFHLV